MLYKNTIYIKTWIFWFVAKCFLPFKPNLNCFLVSKTLKQHLNNTCLHCIHKTHAVLFRWFIRCLQIENIPRTMDLTQFCNTRKWLLDSTFTTSKWRKMMLWKDALQTFSVNMKSGPFRHNESVSKDKTLKIYILKFKSL